MRYLGAFVSSAGGLYKSIERGEELGVNTIMIHPSPPQRWNTKPFDTSQIKKFNERWKKTTIKKLFFHGIYLVNLANPDKQKFHLSKMSLVNYLDLASQINAENVIFHTGSFKDQNNEDEGFERIIYGMNWILEHAENDAVLSLEVAAGSGKVVGDSFEDLARIYEGVKQKERVNFCLDTAHLFGSGHDIVNDLENIISQIDKILGLENVTAVHLNDSKVEFNSKKDRHENLGDGFIGEKALRNFLNHPKLKHLPFILETPAMKDMEEAKVEVKKLQEWAEE